MSFVKFAPLDINSTVELKVVYEVYNLKLHFSYLMFFQIQVNTSYMIVYMQMCH